MSNLLGKRFGRWSVVSTAPRDIGYRERWFCRCDCGVERCIDAHQLTSGKSRSCGCLRIDVHSLPFSVSARNRVKAVYTRNAKSRNLEWSIPDDIFDALTKSVCFYCGSYPSNIGHNGHRSMSRGEYVYNGIDRVDNSKGYVVDNVVSCCRVCNKAKDVLTAEEFFLWATKVVDRYKQREFDKSVFRRQR